MNGEKSDPEIAKGPRFGIRHVQILLLFLNMTCVYMARLSISVLVVAMTNAETTNPDFPEFDWSEKERNYIISSFYWGYVVTQFPAGYLNRRFGAKFVIFFSTFSSAIITLFTPLVVMTGSWKAYCAIRMAHGLIEGPLFPCINDHVAKWSPPQERYFLSALAFTGVNSGTVTSILFSGLIASSSLGWPGVSYIPGGLCIVWCGVWLIFGETNAPSSRFITKEECIYIESSLNRGNDFHKKKIPVPWVAMWKSVTFWALLFSSACISWGSTTLQSQIPSYLNGVLNMDIKNNAYYSTLPYIANWIMTYIYAFMGNMAIRKGWLTLTQMRKISNTIGTWIPTILLICIGFLDDANMELIITILIVNIGLEAGTATGALLSTIDLAPNHAGFVMGIINPICSIIPLVSPLVVGVVVTDVHDRSEWQIIFGISAAVGFLGSLVFLIFGSSEPAPWDAPDFLIKQNIEEPMNNSAQKSTFEEISGFDSVQREPKISFKVTDSN
ncbi:putative inorganic phosphate cotransporter [Eurosta solidaginis]|uniref:putative inorganic phosphate cotransporter n=1 Tax=Eurosta solidaginis TaxID=178769 RepID=UPI003530635A